MFLLINCFSIFYSSDKENIHSDEEKAKNEVNEVENDRETEGEIEKDKLEKTEKEDLLDVNGNEEQVSIRKTCPRNVYPLKLFFFYIEKLGYAGVYLFSWFLIQNIDYGYSLESPRWSGSNVYPQSMFWAKIRKKSEFFY